MPRPQWPDSTVSGACFSSFPPSPTRSEVRRAPLPSRLSPPAEVRCGLLLPVCLSPSQHEHCLCACHPPSMSTAAVLSSAHARVRLSYLQHASYNRPPCGDREIPWGRAQCPLITLPAPVPNQRLVKHVQLAASAGEHAFPFSPRPHARPAAYHNLIKLGSRHRCL